jgi:expansin (peptidoglycan-binding protein)
MAAAADAGGVRSTRAVIGLGFALALGCAKKPAPAPCLPSTAPRTGKATYYDATGSGSCSFPTFAPGDDRMVVALNGPDWSRAAWCGGCLAVDGPAGSVVVRVVDKCPGCASGDLDLSREAFAAIADPRRGRVPVTWREAPCPGDGPIRYRIKERSNAWWLGIQVENHRYPIAKLEAMTEGGAWRELGRGEYNYFTASGERRLGAGPFTLRVTDTRGHALVDEGVALAAGAVVAGAAQFPRCAGDR